MTYSSKDFTGQILKNKTDMNNQIIEGSCFSQETPDTHVFPEDMTGTTFIDCNLDNVFIPQGNTVQGGTQKRYKIQNDLRDWYLDENDNPIELVGLKYWQMNGYPTNPNDIPQYFNRREVLTLCQYRKDEGTEQLKSWFLENPQITYGELCDTIMMIDEDVYEEMIKSQNWCPFESKPELVEKNDGQVIIKGQVINITIEGKGLFEGGLGYRRMDNKIEDLK